MKQPAVYIMASRRNGTLYTGVTSDLITRVRRHKEGSFPGFTKEHEIATLVYFEAHDTMEAAITREKQIKKWRRDWKVALIEKGNLEWLDLYASVCE